MLTPLAVVSDVRLLDGGPQIASGGSRCPLGWLEGVLEHLCPFPLAAWPGGGSGWAVRASALVAGDVCGRTLPLDA